MENWGKALLESYRYLETVVNTIDDMVKKISINSVYYNKKAHCDTLSVFDRVIMLNDRKLNLTNLKVLVDMALDKLKSKDRQFLMLYYIDCLNCTEIAEVLEVSERTVFRRKLRATKEFANALSLITTKSYIETNYKEEHWLFDIYAYYSRDEKDVITIGDEKSGKDIYKTLKQLRKLAI
ncbi:MAG: sigma-70 family RNA polymerase sigma factor [Clostridia bacterium]|nr:sigma-70 family RNA polymerase sigma factor [Clostridia bacterium]